MKKLLVAAAFLSIGSFGLTAQTAKTSAGSNQKVEKKESSASPVKKQIKASPIKAEETTTKTVSSDAVKKVETPAKGETSTNKTAAPKNLKKDGTPDMRYKENQKLKKDGTPDLRYKENHPIKKAVPTQK